jgi:hypothetical protein
MSVPFWASNPKTNDGLGVQGVPPTTFWATLGTQLGEWHDVADAGAASGIVAARTVLAITGAMTIPRISAS